MADNKEIQPIFPKSTHGAGIVCFREGKVILVQINYGKAKGHWILPGGMMEEGEYPHDAAIREFKEETGLSAEISGFVAIRYRKNETFTKSDNAYWVFKGEIASSASIDELVDQITWNEEELQDVKFWSIEEALSHSHVRPHTKKFIELAQEKSKISAKQESPFTLPAPNEDMGYF